MTWFLLGMLAGWATRGVLHRVRYAVCIRRGVLDGDE